MKNAKLGYLLNIKPAALWSGDNAAHLLCRRANSKMKHFKLKKKMKKLMEINTLKYQLGHLNFTLLRSSVIISNTSKNISSAI